MKKSLVLAEKPSVGRDIARVLKCQKKGNGFIEGDRYIVTWALGHLVTLAEPEQYDTKYGTWNLEDLPMLPAPLQLMVMKKTGKQYQAVKTQLHRKDVGEVIIATDAGREGELVARWILDKAKVHKPIKRLWISSVTDQAIKEGFKHLHPGQKYENLYHSAVARAEADWYVGINASRALTTKFNAQLSCGRVQTPTLAMIAQREKEIKQFQPKPFYGFQAIVNGVSFQWKDKKSGEERIFAKDRADSLHQQLKKENQAKITSMRTDHKKNYAPQLYDLTELQRDAHKIFGFSAKETLSTLQRLYEQHKIVSYPRTDSKYLSEDIVPTLKDRLKACGVQPYSMIANKAIQSNSKLGKNYVNNEKVSDHHAIIPTEERVNISALSDKERKLFDLIVKRFISMFLPPYEYEQLTIEAAIGGELFQTRENKETVIGWKAVYQSENTQSLREKLIFKEGQEYKLDSVKMTQKETSPPSYFNEGTLLTAMENPKRFMQGDDKELIETLENTGGLGTVATRADIIEKLFNSSLIEKVGKDIRTTSKGKQLLELVPDELQSPALTAEWEKKLEQISKGSLHSKDFIKDMMAYAKQVVQDIKNSKQSYTHDNITGTRCPDCGNLMLEVKNKFGKKLVCQDRECGHRKNISKNTNARCPNCHKRLVLRGEGEGQIFVCVCGHKEKLSTFNERKSKQKQHKASKRDVNQYMKKQNDEPVNTALADALAKLNLNKD